MNTFPVMKSPLKSERVGCDHWPETVPFALVEAHADRCQRNHKQTPQRLKERGGLDPTELIAVLLDQPYHIYHGSDEDAIAPILAVVKQHEVNQLKKLTDAQGDYIKLLEKECGELTQLWFLRQPRPPKGEVLKRPRYEEGEAARATIQEAKDGLS